MPRTNKQRLIDETGREKVACIGNLVTVTNDLPRSGEDSFLFGKENARVGVDVSGQSPGSRDFSIDLQH
ncbi:MAG: hypothetical protein WA741_24430 [Candidatus Sulfotelmatobacter sp.]